MRNVHANNGICNYEIAQDNNSTSSMIWHLYHKHQIKICQKNESDEKEKDPAYLLMIFIITSNLPFRCVENKFFKLFCNFLNPNF